MTSDSIMAANELSHSAAYNFLIYAQKKNPPPVFFKSVSNFVAIVTY